MKNFIFIHSAYYLILTFNSSSLHSLCYGACPPKPGKPVEMPVALTLTNCEEVLINGCMAMIMQEEYYHFPRGEKRLVY